MISNTFFSSPPTGGKYVYAKCSIVKTSENLITRHSDYMLKVGDNTYYSYGSGSNNAKVTFSKGSGGLFGSGAKFNISLLNESSTSGNYMFVYWFGYNENGSASIGYSGVGLGNNLYQRVGNGYDIQYYPMDVNVVSFFALDEENPAYDGTKQSDGYYYVLLFNTDDF